jgi:hypothetical protein
MRDSKNVASKEAARLQVAARRQRVEAKEAQREAELRREVALREAFAEKPRTLIEKQVAETIENRAESKALRELLAVVSNKAPRLIEPTTIAALRQLAGLPFVRPIAAWKPKGKGRETLFRGLCAHLLATFPMPPFLWSAFFEPDAQAFGPFVAHVAKGGSAQAGVKAGLLPVPLTRKMCHDLLQTPADVSFFKALRRTEVRAGGGDLRFLGTWMGTQAGRRLHSAADEAFWATVIEWFAKNPMADPNQVGPLVDFIAHRRQQDAEFSMKGRGILAMLRAMAEWHGQLAEAKVVYGVIFGASGFRPFALERSARDPSGNYVTEAWKVEEILSSRRLAEEGRALSHCVYSYASSVEQGHTSIWSLSLDGQKLVTVEVRNQARRVVQVRGKFNRAASSREFAIIAQWAGASGLQLDLGRW